MKKFFKIVGYILLGLLVLLIVLGIILPKTIDTTITRTIDTQPQYVYNILNNPAVQSYNAWLQNGAILTESSKSRGVGSGFSWSSESADSGRSVISASQSPRMVAMDVYMNGDDDPMTTTYQLTPSDDGQQTEVSLDWHVDLGFPINIMGPLWTYMGERQFATTLEGLSDLAMQRAGQGLYAGYEIDQVDVEETYYIANRDKVSRSALQQFYSQNLSGLFRVLQETEVQAVGPDCALVYDLGLDTDRVDMAAALPVSEDLSLPNTTTIVLPQAAAVSTDYYGNRAAALPAHEAIQDYMMDRGLLAQVPYVEEYITDVLTEKDPDKWLTRITYRLAEQ